MQGSLLKRILIIIPALIIPLIYSRTTVDPALLPKFITFSIYLLLLAIVVFNSFFKKNTFVSFLNNNLFKFFIGFIIISGLSLIYTINLPDAIFEWSKQLLNFSFLVFASYYFQDEENFIDELCKNIGVLSVIINLIGYYQFYWLAHHQGITHRSTYYVDGTFANRNLFAEILLLTLPFLIYGALKFKPSWKIICSAGALSSLFLITATLTRAVWVGLIISSVCTIVLFLLLKFKNSKEQSNKINFKKLILPVALVLFTITAAVFVYSRQDSQQTFQKQISAISNLNYGAANERIELWKKTVNIFKEHPLTGVGLASWKIEILKYSVIGSKSEDATTFYQEPHNDFLMILSETGIFGLLFYLLLFTAIIYYIIVILRNPPASDHLFYYLMFSGIISYLVISFFSFPKDRIEQNIFLIFMFIPIVIQYKKARNIKEGIPPAKKINSGQRTIFVLFFIPAVLSLFIGVKRIRSDVHTLKALEAKSKSNWQQMIIHIDKAISPYYIMDPMSTPLTWYRGTANFNLGRYPEALNDFSNAEKINPYHVHILNNLGTCYELKKDHTLAISYFNRALSINPVLEDALLNLSASYFNSGMIDSAYATIRRCDLKSENPRYKASLMVIVPAKFELIKKELKTNPQPETIAIQKDWSTRKKEYSKLSPQEFSEKYRFAVNSYIPAFLLNKDWMLKIHAKSVENKLSLEEQVFRDAEYLLKEQKF